MRPGERRSDRSDRSDTRPGVRFAGARSVRRSQRRSDEKKRLERNTNQRDGEEVREETGAEKADDAKRCERCSPSVLVERKELQSLQSERRALFSRID